MKKDRTPPGRSAAVGDDDRQRIRMTGAEVDELDVEPVDSRDELRKTVQFRLHLSPVIVRAPVANELLQLGQLRALRPIGDGFLVGPSRGDHAAAKVVERGLGYVDRERANRAIFGRLARGRRRRDNDGAGR